MKSKRTLKWAMRLKRVYRFSLSIVFFVTGGSTLAHTVECALAAENFDFPVPSQGFAVVPTIERTPLVLVKLREEEKPIDLPTKFKECTEIYVPKYKKPVVPVGSDYPREPENPVSGLETLEVSTLVPEGDGVESRIEGQARKTDPFYDERSGKEYDIPIYCLWLGDYWREIGREIVVLDLNSLAWRFRRLRIGMKWEVTDDTYTFLVTELRLGTPDQLGVWNSLGMSTKMNDPKSDYPVTWRNSIQARDRVLNLKDPGFAARTGLTLQHNRSTYEVFTEGLYAIKTSPKEPDKYSFMIGIKGFLEMERVSDNLLEF